MFDHNSGTPWPICLKFWLGIEWVEIYRGRAVSKLVEIKYIYSPMKGKDGKKILEFLKFKNGHNTKLRIIIYVIWTGIFYY